MSTVWARTIDWYSEGVSGAEGLFIDFTLILYIFHTIVVDEMVMSFA